MPNFSERSQARLATCDPHLQEICNHVIEVFNFTVLCGTRSEDEQNWLYSQGLTKLKYPESNHNKTPSMAVDIAPFPIDWKDKSRFFLMAGMMLMTAHEKGIPLRWGGDWDGDFDFTDQHFNDLVHFELVK